MNGTGCAVCLRVFPGEHFRADSQDAFNVGEKVRQRLREATGAQVPKFRREFAEPAIAFGTVGFGFPEVTEGIAKPDGSFGDGGGGVVDDVFQVFERVSGIGGIGVVCRDVEKRGLFCGVFGGGDAGGECSGTLVQCLQVSDAEVTVRPAQQAESGGSVLWRDEDGGTGNHVGDFWNVEKPR